MNEYLFTLKHPPHSSCGQSEIVALVYLQLMSVIITPLRSWHSFPETRPRKYIQSLPFSRPDLYSPSLFVWIKSLDTESKMKNRFSVWGQTMFRNTEINMMIWVQSTQNEMETELHFFLTSLNSKLIHKAPQRFNKWTNYILGESIKSWHYKKMTSETEPQPKNINISLCILYILVLIHTVVCKVLSYDGDVIRFQLLNQLSLKDLCCQQRPTVPLY